MDGMAESKSGTPLSTALSLQDGNSVNNAYIDVMLGEEIPVLCVNMKEHTQKLIPFRSLYEKDHFFWQKASGWEFFLQDYGINKLKEKAGTPDTAPVETKEGELNIETAFGSEYEKLAQMSKEEKIDILSKESIWLNELLIKKSKDQMIIAEALANTAKDTAMINHAVIKEIIFFADDQAKAFSHDLVIYTSEIVRSSAKLLSENVFSDDLMKTIAEKSKGTVMQHITRVYLNGVAFLAHFNNIVSSSSAVVKIRAAFNLKYRKFYQTLLPHIDSYHLNLDQIFLGGIKVIPPDLFFKWSVGFFIHDIGKAADIQYHEGEAAYDRAKVVDHVNVGYSAITKKTNYPKEAGAIVGYHHEYYGDGDGYGPYREGLQRYKSQHKDAKLDYCIAYDLESMLTYKALAYFPAKVLEIIDIYDSLTDPRRVYRKPMSLEEALDMMYKEFIIKRRKIDPILFDLFAVFIREKESA